MPCLLSTEKSNQSDKRHLFGASLSHTSSRENLTNDLPLVRLRIPVEWTIAKMCSPLEFSDSLIIHIRPLLVHYSVMDMRP